MSGNQKSISRALLFIPRFIYHKLVKSTLSFVYNRLIKPIFEIKDSPHSISLGVALGLWIAFTPTIGIQMIMALIICTIFRANILIAIAMCWISNPVTMVPFYYTYYRVGLVVANERPMTQEEFHDLVHNDYNIIYDFATKNVAKEKLLEPFLIEEEKEKIIYYSGDNPDAADKVNAWLKQNTFARVKVVKILQNYSSTIEKAITEKQFAVVNRNQFKKFSEKKDTSAGVVTQIKANRTGWALFVNLLALGITEIALYMWIGSLIIATLISIPAYPITYRAIVKFR